jgi:hypothetical protein
MRGICGLRLNNRYFSGLEFQASTRLGRGVLRKLEISIQKPRSKFWGFSGIYA